MATAVKPATNGNVGTWTGPPRRKSFVEWLNLVRGACSRNDSTTTSDHRYHCQKVLEERYQSGKVALKGGGVWEPITKAAMSETSGATGGYIIPLDYSDAILSSIVEHSFIFPRATIIPMYSATMEAPRVDVETTQIKTVNALLGGLSFQWGFEKAATETEPTFRMGTWNAWDLLGFCAVSNQWLMDAGAIMATPDAERPEANPLLKAEHYLINLFGKGAMWYAEYAFLQGTGQLQQMPVGIINAPGTITVTRAGGGTIAIADVVGMTSSLLPYSWGQAIWATSPTALAKIQLLAQYFINIELGGMYKVHPKPCGVLSTLPLFITDKLPALGNKGDLVLFDPSLYIIGMRQEVVVDVSPDDKFQNNQSTYRIWMRLDGKPINSNSITLVDGSSKVSPFVVLSS